MIYSAKTPVWVTKLFKNCTWQMPAEEKTIYLTFDDGPHHSITTEVLDMLDSYKAKATFFCIGKNVLQNPAIYKDILARGHAVGNHTQNHLDGWKTGNEKYYKDVFMAGNYIQSPLFRPPYGRITLKQINYLISLPIPYHIIMWGVLSGDFDRKLIPSACLRNVIKNTESGSIVVFHDSEKAYEKLKFALPLVLQYFSEKGYVFKAISV